MTEIIERDPTPEELAEREEYAAGAYDREVLEVKAQREAAYRTEADFLRDYYLRGENNITLEDWKAKVDEIRARYPYPDAPKA